MPALALLTALLSPPAAARTRAPVRAERPVELAKLEGALARAVLDPTWRAGERPQLVAELRGAGDAASLAARGADIEQVVTLPDGRTLIQLRAGWSELETLAAAPGLTRLRYPRRPHPKEVTSEGVAAIFTQDWSALGLTGAGVTIAVLDVGFQGYEALLGSELPEAVEAQLQGGWRDSAHGTDVAQILHDIAPDAELLLYSFDTDVEFLAAAQQIAASRAHIVNASVGFDNVWHADGSSPWSQAVDLVHDAGIAWFAAAGNESDNYWVGTLADEDGDGWLEFDGSELLLVETDWTDRAEVSVSLRWDEPFGAAGSDLDLYLDATDYTPGDEPCGYSEEQQDGDDDPYEYAWCALDDGAKYAYASVFVYDGVGAGRTGWIYSDYRVPEESRTYTQTLTLPADAAGGIAVAAYDLRYDDIADYSSRGPTDDGRDKPDLTGPTEVSTTNGTFDGTSAATPHAAGAAALALQASLFTMGPEDLRSWLSSQVTDLGTPGFDYTFGYGYLQLDEPPEPIVADTGADTDPPEDAPPDADPILDEGPPRIPGEASCSCTTGATGPGAAWLLLTLLGLLGRRTRG